MNIAKTTKERPILFNSDMVRALLDGSKTQTRRVVKFPLKVPGTSISVNDCAIAALPSYCPYGQPGDRLWVRESWKVIPDNFYDFGIQYTADNEVTAWMDHGLQYEHLWREMNSKGRPSIHMPRAFSRLLLEITAVRCERLQDISESDAVAEGIEIVDANGPFGLPTYRDYSSPHIELGNPEWSYKSLWQKINGPDSWAVNPWVWVVEFKVVA